MQTSFILRFHSPHWFSAHSRQAQTDVYIFAVEEVKQHQPSNNQLSIFPRTDTSKQEATTKKDTSSNIRSKNTGCNVVLTKNNDAAEPFQHQTVHCYSIYLKKISPWPWAHKTSHCCKEAPVLNSFFKGVFRGPCRSRKFNQGG